MRVCKDQSGIPGYFPHSVEIFMPASSTIFRFQYFSSALSLKPGDALVYKRRADVLGKQGKKGAAIEDYKRAIVIQTTKR